MPSSSENWWEIQVLSSRDLEELVFWRLQNFGCQGTASQLKDDSDRLWVRAYLPVEKTDWLDLAALALWLRQDAIAVGQTAPIVQWSVIDAEDWSNSWKQYWHPQEVGDLFMVYPAWIEPQVHSDRHVLRLDPGSAFGTGTHATTQLCLEALEMRMTGLPEGTKLTIADIGCGSGILSIGAILLGAQMVYAVDTDILAVKATHHNRELNQIAEDRIWVGEGDLKYLFENLAEPVDGFVCNILADAIIEMVPKFNKLIQPKGWGILSGILLEQVPAVSAALDKHKWIVATLWKRQAWSCLTIRKA